MSRFLWFTVYIIVYAIRVADPE